MSPNNNPGNNYEQHPPSQGVHSPINDFYRNQSVFITGGTGFVGKVLIEKLLYEFRDIGNIYVMLRPKCGQLSSSRLKELLQCPVFDRIRANCPEQLAKVQVINGDTGFAGLGINPLDVRTLSEHVSIVFHSAATIRFDEPLKYALKINTLGTKRTIQLAKKFKHLKAFVHVSTAYCTVHKHNIEEKVYLEPIAPDKVLEMADWMDEESFEKVGQTFYRGRPCSYHFTKSLAEHLIAEEVCNGFYYYDCPAESPTRRWRPFPAAIVRPSIISAAWREPFPGWVDNYNAITGFLMVSGKGVLRTAHVIQDYLCDLVPVDIVINTCISSAFYIANCHSEYQVPNDTDGPSGHFDPSKVFVVNCVSGTLNPISWGRVRDISLPIHFKYPSNEMFRVPGVRFHRYQAVNRINEYLEHTIPCYVVDFVFKFLGLAPVLNQVYQKVHRATTALEFFTTNEWTFRCENLLILDRMLRSKPNTDELEFRMDSREIEWPAYFENYVLGIRKFLSKEDPDTIDAARKQLLMIYLLTAFAKAATVGTILYQLLSRRSYTRTSYRMLSHYLRR